jgi:hypothetical protein
MNETRKFTYMNKTNELKQNKLVNDEQDTRNETRKFTYMNKTNEWKQNMLVNIVKPSWKVNVHIIKLRRSYLPKPEGLREITLSKLIIMDIMVLLYSIKPQRSNKPKLKDRNMLVYRMHCANNQETRNYILFWYIVIDIHHTSSLTPHLHSSCFTTNEMQSYKENIQKRNHLI